MTTLEQATEAANIAQQALTDALQSVAHTVSNNEDELRILRDYLAHPHRTALHDAAIALDDLLLALGRWKQASEAFMEAARAEQIARQAAPRGTPTPRIVTPAHLINEHPVPRAEGK